MKNEFGDPVVNLIDKGFNWLVKWILMWTLICLSGAGLVIWTAVHFIHKFW